MVTSLIKFKRSGNGNVAIETALILPIFLFLVFSILEFGIIMFIRSVVDDAVNEGARFGITGDNYYELQNLSDKEEEMDREEFIISVIYEKLSALPDGNVSIRTRSLGKIESISNSGNIITDGSGGGGDVVSYEVNYEWDILSPLVSGLMGKDGKYIITAQTVVKNEDF